MNARSLALLGAMVSFAGLTTAQNDEILPSNGAETVYFYNDPSVGGVVGSPTTGGDGFWKSTAGDLTVDSGGTATWDGFENHFLGSTDWTTGCTFWDTGIGFSHAATLGGGGTTGPLGVENLVPDWFTSGSISALLSIGNLGPSVFPNPCSVSPTGCTNGAGGGTPAICPPPVTGYATTVDLVTSIPFSGDGVSADYLHHFAPGGMPLFTSAGTCGLGDFDFSGAHSTDENQADAMLTAGDAYLGGFQAGPSTSLGSPTGPIADLLTEMNDTANEYDNSAGISVGATIAGGIVEARTGGTGYAPNNGGSSLYLDKNGAGAPATYGLTIRSFGGAGLLSFPSASPAFLSPPGPPGFTLAAIGATLLISPTGFFNSLFTAFAGTPIVAIAGGATLIVNGTGNTTAMPALGAGGSTPTLHAQAFILTGVGPITAVHTTAFVTRTL